MSDEKLTDNGRPPVGSGLQNEHERAQAAELERLRANYMTERSRWIDERDARQAAEARLADATALLSWLERDVLYIASEARRKVCAFLANQPAAPARTEAEKGVLDAMAVAEIDVCELSCQCPKLKNPIPVCRAELARRGLK